jgi:hypothetical protein
MTMQGNIANEKFWIPAFAGMTDFRGPTVMPAKIDYDQN